MKKEMKVVMNLTEIQREIERRLNYPVNLWNYLFETISNDSYKSICISNIEETLEDMNNFNESEIIEYYGSIGSFKKQIRIRQELIRILREEGIEDEVLLDISW